MSHVTVQRYHISFPLYSYKRTTRFFFCLNTLVDKKSKLSGKDALRYDSDKENHNESKQFDQRIREMLRAEVCLTSRTEKGTLSYSSTSVCRRCIA